MFYKPHQRGEPGGHPPEDELVPDFLEELRRVAPLLLDEIDHLQVARGLGLPLPVGGHAPVLAGVGVAQAADRQRAGVAVGLDLEPGGGEGGTRLLNFHGGGLYVGEQKAVFGLHGREFWNSYFTGTYKV